MKKKPSISPPLNQPPPACHRTPGSATAARSPRPQPTAAPWRCLAAGGSPLLPLSLAALVGTLAIASFAARSNARLAPFVQPAQSVAGGLLSRRAPAAIPSQPAARGLNSAAARPAQAERSPAPLHRSWKEAVLGRSVLAGILPAVPPEQSRVLWRLAQLQAQTMAQVPLPAATSAPTPALSLTLRDAIALALAEPTVKAAYLNQLSQQGVPSRQPWNLSARALLLPAVPAPELFAASIASQHQDWEHRAELNQAIALTIVRYHRLLHAQAVVQACQQSLAEAQRLLARQQALVAAGRQAPTALPPLQQTVTRSARRLQAAREALASEQWQLLAALDLGEDVSLVASESIAPAIAVPVAAYLDPAALWELAQQQHPAYRRAQFILQSAEPHQQVAAVKSDGTVPADLRPASLQPTAIATDDDIPHPAAIVPPGRAANAVARARQQFLQTRRELQAAVSTATQSVQTHFAGLEQAQQSLAAAEAQFAAQERLQAAGQSRVSSLQAAQERLDTERQAAIAAQIAYLNALAELDRALGIAALRWGVVPRD